MTFACSPPSLKPESFGGNNLAPSTTFSVSLLYIVI